MESSIPRHLQCPRSRHCRVPDGHVPPCPSFVARHPACAQRVATAYFGLQSHDAGAPREAALADLATAFAQPMGPGHWDRAH